MKYTIRPESTRDRKGPEIKIPATAAGRSNKEFQMSLISNCPPKIRPKIESEDPITKYGDMVARKDGPGKSFRANAIGGPPTPTAVAMKPLTPPARITVFRFRDSVSPLSCNPIATKRRTPKRSPNRSVEIRLKANTPSATPGIRPIRAEANAVRSTFPRSRQANIKFMIGFTIRIGIGISSGLMRAKSGTAKRFAPNPIDP